MSAQLKRPANLPDQSFINYCLFAHNCVTTKLRHLEWKRVRAKMREKEKESKVRSIDDKLLMKMKDLVAWNKGLFKRKILKNL